MVGTWSSLRCHVVVSERSPCCVGAPARSPRWGHPVISVQSPGQLGAAMRSPRRGHPVAWAQSSCRRFAVPRSRYRASRSRLRPSPVAFDYSPCRLRAVTRSRRSGHLVVSTGSRDRVDTLLWSCRACHPVLLLHSSVRWRPSCGQVTALSEYVNALERSRARLIWSARCPEAPYSSFRCRCVVPCTSGSRCHRVEPLASHLQRWARLRVWFSPSPLYGYSSEPVALIGPAAKLA